MRIVGITGGIGSGKSTVSGILARKGAKVIDTDVLAREVVAPGSKALEEIAAFFGEDVLLPEGELDRKKLGNIVFNSKDKLEVLNGITHKYIIDKMLKDIEAYKLEGKWSLIVLEVPVPVGRFKDTADEIWVVTADRNIRLRRIMERNGLTEEEALTRMKAQLKDEDYLKLADIIIYNNGNQSALESRIEELLNQRGLLGLK